MQITSKNRLPKQIKKFYKKLLKKLGKNSIKDTRFNLSYLIYYLMFLRDTTVFNSNKENFTTDKDNLIISSAIMEIEEYKSCFFKYFNVQENGVVTQKDDTLPKEVVLKKFKEEQDQHWSSFWALVSEVARLSVEREVKL